MTSDSINRLVLEHLKRKWNEIGLFGWGKFDDNWFSFYIEIILVQTLIWIDDCGAPTTLLTYNVKILHRSVHNFFWKFWLIEILRPVVPWHTLYRTLHKSYKYIVHGWGECIATFSFWNFFLIVDITFSFFLFFLKVLLFRYNFFTFFFSFFSFFFFLFWDFTNKFYKLFFLLFYLYLF